MPPLRAKSGYFQAFVAVINTAHHREMPAEIKKGNGRDLVKGHVNDANK